MKSEWNSLNDETLDLFVPGRLCLFGEHSDWAGGFRRSDPSIEKGHCLIAGTDQGISSSVKSHPASLIIDSSKLNLPSVDRIDIPMDRQSLDQASRSGGFFSYAAGTAYEILKSHPVGGLRIDAITMNLPLKKGLSSSAAICVTIARAFNRMYDLNLGITDEMELAYRGEIRTGSNCGRMDQACAFGYRPTFLTFDGENWDIEALSPKDELFILIVDLMSEKNTRRILSDLNAAFVSDRTALGDGVRDALGRRNKAILLAARRALEDADAPILGELMIEAQKNFDELVAPACLSELGAPKLHALLQDKTLQDLSEGGKGVGSQGDGCAQFIFRDFERREKAIVHLMETYRVECFELTIPGPIKNIPNYLFNIQ